MRDARRHPMRARLRPAVAAATCGRPTYMDTSCGGHAASEKYDEEPNNLMRTEGSHSCENNNNEIEKFWVLHLKTLASMLDVLENIIPLMENCKLTANAAENEKTMKGLLGSYYTMMEKLFVISGGIFLSYAYFLAQKPQGSVEGIWMAIFIGIFIASLSNFILLIHASYLKERGSIDGCEPRILKWLLLLVLAFLYAVFCILLQAFANASDLVLWLIGIIGLCSIVLGWVWFFYTKWPKVLEEIGMSESLRPLALPPEAVQTGQPACAQLK
ncbi:unnamed protein product [Miscanthus lutarioriparius]|uniref:Uncharacterized protein n=1 Tax=Miscanthus lutarioriparius TaxID=422564 RepID=A0A811Q5T4_9POAL|nr:unnamed protein product [Miscanthus lutarioriparius]